MAKNETNAMEFNLSLEKFAKGYLPETQTLFIKKIAMDLADKLIKMSPVDTGMFKGAWVAGVNNVDSSKPNTPDKSGVATMARIQSMIGTVQAGDTIYISNNMEYAVKLEHGHSKQAPQGMVAISINFIEAQLQARQKIDVEDM